MDRRAEAEAVHLTELLTTQSSQLKGPSRELRFL
jgi:hypothetical protein